MSKMILALVALTVSAASADAQRNCKKGIPCGGSCISATKVCRVGSGTATKDGDKQNGDSAYEAALAEIRRGANTNTQPYGLISVRNDSSWVASVDGAVFYRSTCLTARKLTPDESIYFLTEIDAMKAGYRRSKARGC